MPLTQNSFFSRSAFLLTALVSLSAYSFAQAVAYQHGGITGKTNKPYVTPPPKGEEGCYCHCDHPTATTSVMIQSDDSVFELGKTYPFTVTVRHPVASFAGVDIAAYSGTLNPAGTATKKPGAGEITHKDPVSIGPGGAVFQFTYTPIKQGTDTIYATANAVNGDGANDDQQCVDVWNYARKFVIDEHGVHSVLAKASKPALGISPNPASRFVKIERESSGRLVDQMDIVDVDGRVVRKLRQAGTITLDVSGFPNGSYWIEGHRLVVEHK